MVNNNNSESHQEAEYLQLKHVIFQRGKIKSNLTKLKNHFDTVSQKHNIFDRDITALSARLQGCKERHVEIVARFNA